MQRQIRRNHREGDAAGLVGSDRRQLAIDRRLNAPNWAGIASLVETCKLNGVDPEAYLADLLAKLVNLWPADRIDDLLPSATNPTAQAA